ncbi:MAG: sarcosine oxidase subunit delta, partial [Billgrantia desiderata]
RKFFNVTRNTVTYEILETYKMGERPRITAESLASGEIQGNVQVAGGGQQTVGASNAAVEAVKGEQA